jgi:short-subunit dehydrogenase
MRNRRPKALKDQVIVITGASSGIGLATARMAAKRGARVVMAARNEPDLNSAAEEIRFNGGRVLAVATDVADEAAVDRLGEAALLEFGTIDTWVNNAGLSIYGKLTEVPLADKRKMFDINFWGVVHGCRTAVKLMRHRGGVLINIGSEVSDIAIPLQGMYSASKHAVKGFTDALRMEIEHDGAPISVTLVKPGAIDTPYPEHAKNYLASFPTNPPPQYAPEAVARTILYAAEHPVRDVFVGAGGKLLSLLGNLAPRTMDRIMERRLFEGQQSGRPRHGREGLQQAGSSLGERGEYASHDGGHVAGSSAYTQMSLHPVLTSAAVLGIGLAATLIRQRQGWRR